MPQEQMPDVLWVKLSPNGGTSTELHCGPTPPAGCIELVPASRLSALAERVEQAEALLKEVLNAEHCPDCPDQGWYYSSRGYGQEPDQAQCEWCERTENSLFKVKCRISSFLHDGKEKP